MAKKYIDAEKLIADIGRLQKAAAITMEELQKDEPSERMRGELDAYDYILEFINSLQQEQPCDTCTNDKGCVTCKDGELWEGKEQQEVDLEKEIDKTVNECTDGYNFDWDRFARHFYELGKKCK